LLHRSHYFCRHPMRATMSPRRAHAANAPAVTRRHAQARFSMLLRSFGRYAGHGEAVDTAMPVFAVAAICTPQRRRRAMSPRKYTQIEIARYRALLIATVYATILSTPPRAAIYQTQHIPPRRLHHRSAAHVRPECGRNIAQKRRGRRYSRWQAGRHASRNTALQDAKQTARTTFIYVQKMSPREMFARYARGACGDGADFLRYVARERYVEAASAQRCADAVAAGR